jgi:hypothetical protein
VLYRISITPQVCYLEAAINDRYDYVERRIFIEDGEEHEPVPLYRKVEGKAQVLYKKGEGAPLVLYTKAETSKFSADFTIHIPADVNFNISELNAFVESYRLASKTFKVKIV